jgi:hypothetical protein
MNFIEIDITTDLLNKAKQEHSKRKIHNKFTQCESDVSFVGLLGETILKDYLGNRWQDKDRLGCDCSFRGFDNNWHTAEVKTKATKREPRSHHEQSVYEYTTQIQKPNFYIFVNIFEENGNKTADGNYKKAWIVGVMPSTWIDTEKTVFRPAGSVMPGSNVTAKRDNYFIQLRDLYPFR